MAMNLDPSKQKSLQSEDVSTICKVKIEQFSEDSHEDGPFQVIDLPDAELIVKEEDIYDMKRENGSEEGIKNSSTQSGDGGNIEPEKSKKRSCEVLDGDERASKREAVETIFMKIENPLEETLKHIPKMENLLEENIKREPSEACDEIVEASPCASKSLEKFKDRVNDAFEDDLSEEGREANRKNLTKPVKSNWEDLSEEEMNCELGDASDETEEQTDSVSNSSEESSDTNEFLVKRRPNIPRLPFPDYDGKSRTSDGYVKLYSGSTLTNMAFIANERATKAKRSDQKPKVAESIKLNILEEAKANFIGGKVANSIKGEETQTERDSDEMARPVPPILSGAHLKDRLQTEWNKLESVKAFLKTL